MHIDQLTQPLFEHDCAPIRIAHALGMTPEEVKASCQDMQLWRPGRGMSTSQITRAVYMLGFDYKDRGDLLWSYRRAPGSPYRTTSRGKPLRAILGELDPKGTYLIMFKDHAIAYVRGKIHDIAQYSQGRYVVDLIQIMPKKAPGLQESIIRAPIVSFYGDPITLSILVNPTPMQLETLANRRDQGNIRFLLTNSSMYAWDARQAIHGTVWHYLRNAKIIGPNENVRNMPRWGRGELVSHDGKLFLLGNEERKKYPEHPQFARATKGLLESTISQ